MLGRKSGGLRSLRSHPVRAALLAGLLSSLLNLLAGLLYLLLPPWRWAWHGLGLFLLPGEALMRLWFDNLHGLGLVGVAGVVACNFFVDWMTILAGLLLFHRWVQKTR
jgi:hypothetical protein